MSRAASATARPAPSATRPTRRRPLDVLETSMCRHVPYVPANGARVKGTMETLRSHGLPEFCDWDFCRDEGFGNYRAPDSLYMDPQVCGFSSLSD